MSYVVGIFVLCLVLGPNVSSFWVGDVGVYDMQRLLLGVGVTFGAVRACARLAGGAPGAGRCGRHNGNLRGPSSQAQQVWGCVGLIACMGLWSASLAASPRHALAEYALYVLLGVSVVQMAQEARKASVRRGVLWALGGACLLHESKSLVFYAWWLADRMTLTPDPFMVGFSNMRFVNHFQTATLPLLALLTTTYVPTRKWRVVSWGVTALWWALAFVLGGRGTQLGMAAGCGMCLVLFGQRAWTAGYLRQMVGACLAGVVLAWCLQWAIPHAVTGHMPDDFLFGKLNRLEDGGSIQTRLALWRAAWGMFLQHPLLGAGPMHFAALPNAMHLDASAPHNWVLQIAAEWGGIVLLAVLMLLGMAVKGIMHTRVWVREGDITPAKQEWMAYCTAFFALWTDGLVSNTFMVPIILTTMAVVFALMLGMANEHGWMEDILAPSTAQGGGAWQRVLVGSCWMAMACILWVGMWPETVLALHGWIRPDFAPDEIRWFRPRWFLDGHFDVPGT